MLFGPDPLAERLMWHNHFATNTAKVGSIAFSRSENKPVLSSETFITLAMIQLMLNRLQPKGIDAERGRSPVPAVGP
jgi:hypothetical protein